MRRLPMALALSTLCLTSCAKQPVRIVPLTPDAAPLAACPTAFPVPPSLPPLQPFTLGDGRVVVLLDTVIARDSVVATFIIQSRGAWHACRSAVTYVLDWSARLRGETAVRP